MKLKTIHGEVIFALEGAKTVFELVAAALSAKKSLYGADLRGANLRAADLGSANLRGADLRSANLGGAGLGRANLREADLRAADLYSADLGSADLRAADLGSANLGGANLGGADLNGANLRGASLNSANLGGANLGSANLGGANLRGANLYSAGLGGAKNAELALAQIQFIPEEGSFRGWKKCKNGAIVHLGIASGAKRSHGTERKCRCSRAKVLAIYDRDGKPLQEATSLYDSTFIYRLGKVVVSDGWDENRWNTCGKGIHFFLTRLEAENFNF
jgi:hypothetical protein